MTTPPEPGLPPVVMDEIHRRIAEDLHSAMSVWRPEAVPLRESATPYQLWLWDTAGKMIKELDNT